MIPKIEDDLLEQALLVVDHIATTARERGVSVMDIDRDAFMEGLMVIGAQPRSIRRQCFRWLNKRHPRLQFGFESCRHLI